MFLVAIFVIGIVSGATAAVVGFGIGSLLTPLLLTRFSPVVAIAVVSIPHLIATALRMVQHRQATNRDVLVRFGLPSAVGGVTGAWLQASLSESWLFKILGVLLVATAVANLTRGFGGWKPPTPLAVILGLIVGVFGGLVGNQGGLRAAGLLAFDLSPRAFLATGTAVALLIDVARTPIYVSRAADALLALAVPIAVATAGCVVGTIFGEKVFLGLPQERYRQVIGVAVGILGVWLLAR
jgi:uncharacterized protein